MFGNAPKALWQRWTHPDDHNRIDLACRALLIVEADRTVLMETGVGAFFPPKMRERFGIIEANHVLLENLNRLGFNDADIDVIVLSHLHFDHAGGLMSAWSEGCSPTMLFPNAQFVVGQAAWERACNPHPRDRASFIPEINAALKQSGRLHLVDGDRSAITGPHYRFHESHGHTPGMLLTEIATSFGPVVFGADLIPGRPWVHSAITMGYDRYPELLINEKTALLDRLVEQGGSIFFTHDPECALARVQRNERGRFEAIDPRHELAGIEC